MFTASVSPRRGRKTRSGEGEEPQLRPRLMIVNRRSRTPSTRWRLECFVRGTETASGTCGKRPRGRFSRRNSLGGGLPRHRRLHAMPTAARGLLRGTDNALWHMWQVAPAVVLAVDLARGGLTSAPAVAATPMGGSRSSCAAPTTASGTCGSDPGGSFSPWNRSRRVGLGTGGCTQCRRAARGLHAGTDNALWHMWKWPRAVRSAVDLARRRVGPAPAVQATPMGGSRSSCAAPTTPMAHVASGPGGRSRRGLARRRVGSHRRLQKRRWGPSLMRGTDNALWHLARGPGGRSRVELARRRVTSAPRRTQRRWAARGLRARPDNGSGTFGKWPGRFVLAVDSLGGGLRDL